MKSEISQRITLFISIPPKHLLQILKSKKTIKYLTNYIARW
jgi:hypothetical protein